MLSFAISLLLRASAAHSISLQSFVPNLEDYPSAFPSIGTRAFATSNVSLAPVMNSEAFFSLPPHAPTRSSPLAMAYYPDWVSDTFPPERIDFTRFHWIDYAFALPTANHGITWDNPDQARDTLYRLVTQAHTYGCKVKVSVGGWTGSQHFSSAVATAKSRRTFVSNILLIFDQFGLDGIDIDWEYPGHEGNPGNEISPADSDNFLLFLQLLRKSLPAFAIITVAAAPSPFVDSKSTPMKNVSEFVKVLDWILIMNYDVWGSSSNPGPNAPLYDGCSNSSQPDANAVAAYRSWTSAGVPPEKLVLGLPGYGYVSSSQATSLRTRSTMSRIDSRTDSMKVVSDDGTPEGQVSFNQLVKQGALIWSSNGFVASGGFERKWDACSATPYLWSPVSGQVIPYDDPESISMKVKFAEEMGMLGVNMWTLNSDTADWALSNSILSTFGYR